MAGTPEVWQLDLSTVEGCYELPSPVIQCSWPVDVASSTEFSVTISDGWRVWHRRADLNELGGKAVPFEVKVERSRAALSQFDPEVVYKLSRDVVTDELLLYWGFQHNGTPSRFKMPPMALVADPKTWRVGLMQKLITGKAHHDVGRSALQAKQTRLSEQAGEARSLSALASAPTDLRDQMVAVLNQVKVRTLTLMQASDSDSAGSRELNEESQSVSMARPRSPESGCSGAAGGAAGESFPLAVAKSIEGQIAAGATFGIKARKPRAKRDRTQHGVNSTSPKPKQQKVIQAAGERGATGLTRELDLTDLE
eukprot:TRINITY_DN14039_c0_g1_i1.p1 TRINITY_DN14039_c0_g1~~TRINITY_DN14039_c0_g1_i1.p1  ORF type:complete len:310 (+),score=62.73 TRINITY_DN14039_c0_g1_i1:188-1117(+)